MPNWSSLTFEGKHADEKVLHFSGPSRIRTTYEIIRILLPSFFLVLIIVMLGAYHIISWSTVSIMALLLFIFMWVSTWYKLYRVKRNRVIITSKRVLFSGIDGLFKDYTKKITLDNIRNVNYFTDTLLGKIYGFGSLEIQASHDGQSNIFVYHVPHAKFVAHYIDKIISLTPEQRATFAEFDPDYFKNWKE